MQGAPSGNVVHPDMPLGPAVDMVWGSNKAFSTPLQGALNMRAGAQQGVLQNSVVDAQKLQGAFPALQSSSLDKSNKSIVVLPAIGGGAKMASGKVGSTEKIR